jgi:hypothetical protein
LGDPVAPLVVTFSLWTPCSYPVISKADPYHGTFAWLRYSPCTIRDKPGSETKPDRRLGKLILSRHSGIALNGSLSSRTNSKGRFIFSATFDADELPCATDKRPCPLDSRRHHAD